MEQKTAHKYAAFTNRLSEAWNYKAPVLISVPYYFALSGNIRLQEVITAIVASYLTIAGIAGFGYFVNDITDAKQDALAGKPNGIARLNLLQQTAVLFAIFMLALLPWLYLPLQKLNAPFLILQFFLFVVYSVPPFRLKERGFYGILTDAMYAHVNPSLLAALTFIILIRKPVSEFKYYLLFLVLWQLFSGIRNIVQHQITDKTNDNNAGVNTFVANSVFNRPQKLTAYFLVPAELLCFGVFILFLGINGIGWQGLVFCAGMMLLQYLTLKNSTEFQLPIWGKILLITNQLYLVWMPLSILLTICFTRVEYLLLLIPHVVLFKEVRTRIGALLTAVVQFVYYRIPLPYYTLCEIVWEINNRFLTKKK